MTLQKYDLESGVEAKQRWLSATLESIADAVIGVDPDGVVLFMNSLAEHLTGWSRGDAGGKPIEDVFRTVDDAGLPIDAGAWPGAPRTPGDDAREVWIEPMTGGRVRVEPGGSAIVDRQGAPLGRVIVFREATSGAEIERRSARSEERVAIKVTGPGVGHEINNALAYVISNIGFSVEGVRDVLVRVEGLEAPKGQRPSLGAVADQLRDIAAALDDAGEGADRIRRTVRDRLIDPSGLAAPDPGGAAAPAPAVAPEPPRTPSRRARLLVIDDDEAVAAAMARLLGLRHDVVTETDPRAALARFARGEVFDVTFCDLTMPNTSGADFYEALVCSAPEAAPRVVFMTGGAFTEEARSFLDGVSNASLTKPFTLEAVEAIVAEWMAGGPDPT